MILWVRLDDDEYHQQWQLDPLPAGDQYRAFVEQSCGEWVMYVQYYPEPGADPIEYPYTRHATRDLAMLAAEEWKP